MQALDDVLAMLRAAVEAVASRPEECARSPGRDFTRSRKLPLAELLWLIVTMGTDTLGIELARASGMSADAPTAGALSQQWAKLNDEAMPRLHAAFLSMFEPVPTMGRYWLLACDGTELALAPDASDAETRMPPARGSDGRNSVHLTCAYDVARGVFRDMVCQGGRSQDEHAAARELVARCAAPPGLEALWLLDRGFWSLGLAWAMGEAGAHFVCRVRDGVAEGLLRHLPGGPPPPGGPLDAELELCCVRSRSAAGRTRPGEPWLYRVVRGAFGGLPDGGPGECWLSVRLVRVEAAVPGGWLWLATDLPRGELAPGELAALYARRWSEETAFAELKHTIGLECPHVRTRGRVEQECWGRLTLHAACSIAASMVPRPRSPGRATDRTACFKLVLGRLRGAAADVARMCSRLTQAVRQAGQALQATKEAPGAAELLEQALGGARGGMGRGGPAGGRRPPHAQNRSRGGAPV